MEDIVAEGSYLSYNEEIVGFDDDAKKIIRGLIGGTRHLDIISIVGMAGSGKTTLARKAYNDRSILNHFDCRMCVSVSQNERKLVLLEILKQIVCELPITLDEDSLADMLCKRLYRRRFLIVLDDLQGTDAWYDLSIIFPNNYYGSRILVTTRLMKVAKELKHYSHPYCLSFLSDKHSLELLLTKVFEGERCPGDLRRVGARVAKISKGLPIVVVKIAEEFLKVERHAPLWLEVAKCVSLRYLEEEITKMQPIYDRLEDHLKPCLLYMGLFPGRYEIPAPDLVKWWIAEELVQDDDPSRLEEKSKYYLDELVDSDLVTVSKRRSNGEIKYCKVVDQVREFCVRKVTEEKFMQGTVSRLCMYVHDTMKSGSFTGQGHDGQLEFIAHPKFSRPDRTTLFPLLNNLRLVRVLDLLDIYLQDSWATAFQALTHLRYLAIFVKVFKFKWVSHLFHLQTLRVRSSFIMMSSAIWKMENLRHVDINEFAITWEENERVKFEESPELVLDKLTTLGMCSIAMADMTPKFWGKFPNLEELRLHIHELGNYPLLGKTYGGYSFPSSLKVLSLSDIFLTDELVSSIAKLQRLEMLKLSEIYFIGEQHWDLRDNEFSHLRVLKLHHVFMIKWIFSDDTFPVLETLVIKSCSKLEEIPIEVDFTRLEIIKVIDCSDSVGTSAQRIKEAAAEEMGYEVIVLIS